MAVKIEREREPLPECLCSGLIGANGDGGGGNDWSMQSSSQNVTTDKPTPSFLQAGCPSCQPTNSVTALKGMYAAAFIGY